MHFVLGDLPKEDLAIDPVYITTKICFALELASQYMLECAQV